MTGAPESDRCYFCGGKLKSGLTTIPSVIVSNVVVVKQAPAEVCTQCGEPVMSSQVAREVDSLLKQLIRPNLEVSVLTYEQPAPAAA
jgi:YgiT-type zinc finger domain-containing protein